MILSNRFVFILVVVIAAATSLGLTACVRGPTSGISETLERHGVNPRVDGSLRARPYLAPWLEDALAIWFADERDGESLRAIVRWVGARDDDLPCREPEVDRQIRCWLGRPGTSIGLEHADKSAARFWLAVPALSDHIFFVDVQRSGPVLRARSWGQN